MSDYDEAEIRKLETALSDARLAVFQNWCEQCGYPFDGWTTNADGDLVTPLGDPINWPDGGRAVQRLAAMARTPASEWADVFRPGYLLKSGSPTLQILAVWDGTKCVGEAVGNMPKDPALFVCFEGEDTSEAKWINPLKAYRLMEFGFRLTNHPGMAGDGKQHEPCADPNCGHSRQAHFGHGRCTIAACGCQGFDEGIPF